jgi:TonB family protein
MIPAVDADASLHARRRRERRSRFWVAIGLSVAFHLLFGAFLLFVSLLDLRIPRTNGPSSPQVVTLRPLSHQQWVKNRGAAAPAPSPRQNDSSVAVNPPPAPERKPEPLPKGQIVDVAPGNGEDAPDAKYLAESANRTQHETKAKEQTAFYRNAMPKRTTSVPNEGTGHDNVEKPQIAGNNGLGNDDRPLRETAQKSMMEIPDLKPRQQVSLKPEEGPGPGKWVANRTESDAVKGNSSRLKIQPGTEGGEADASNGKRGSPGVANLVPSSAVLDKITGAAPNDHLGDVDEGEGTYLNTKEWKYSSFFNRVKQSVGMHWDPGQQLRQRDRTGEIYGGRDRYTVLNVTLNDHGMVKDVFVDKSCGLDFLDLEAISAFERAQPFPNPPPGLMSADATVHFTFGFYLEMGSGAPRMRLFRQAN